MTDLEKVLKNSLNANYKITKRQKRFANSFVATQLFLQQKHLRGQTRTIQKVMEI